MIVVLNSFKVPFHLVHTKKFGKIELRKLDKRNIVVIA